MISKNVIRPIGKLRAFKSKNVYWKNEPYKKANNKDINKVNRNKLNGLET